MLSHFDAVHSAITLHAPSHNRSTHVRSWIVSVLRMRREISSWHLLVKFATYHSGSDGSGQSMEEAGSTNTFGDKQLTCGRS